jgi:hypothetical protein
MDRKLNNRPYTISPNNTNSLMGQSFPPPEKVSLLHEIPESIPILKL